MLTEQLTSGDVQTFLKQLSTAIELDQVNVDSLPRESFSTTYDDSRWRTWRHDHRTYIEKLLPTVDAIPPVMLEKMTEIAATYEPAHVRSILQALFAEIVSGCRADDLDTAEKFFGALVKEISGQRHGSARHADPRASLLQWLHATDPLRIAHDPEVGHGQVRHLDVANLRRA
ncbi:hypothetical protein H8A97_26385 [Bradyrhizobium sp. Arg62]|uniref:hypothetical protein n=1 Tax=Bradyrhizobium brasilense TaxID=1419277 RepID=UPI001E5648FB|nr:hypothetical protein [Bradyrhizobium brasilense]MCC8948544.1 hypothetical protein [Bradyrhizobium brasilense]